MNYVCLINGAHAVRERNSEDMSLLECGCASTDSEWVQLCKAHAIEVTAYSEAAAARVSVREE